MIIKHIFYIKKTWIIIFQLTEVFIFTFYSFTNVKNERKILYNPLNYNTIFYKKLKKIKLFSKMFKLRIKNKIIYPKIHLSNFFCVNINILNIRIKKRKKFIFLKKTANLYSISHIKKLYKKRPIDVFTQRGIFYNFYPKYKKKGKV